MIPCLDEKTTLNLTHTPCRTMIRPIDPPQFLNKVKQFPVIDVRSPGEFAQGHLPGACNIPLFTDAERAVVGTLYVQSGREDAIQKGLDFGLSKTGWYLKTLRKIAVPGNILLHCWRGGLRSAMMAEVFNKAGYDVELLNGGYKAYRRFIRESLSAKANIVVLGGFTGSGKTDLLHAIKEKGEQVIDLEGLASHKGSVFGALGQPPQPSNEQFENSLYSRWSELDLSGLVWVEDESRMIGRVTLPDPTVEHISNGMLIKIEMDITVRINRMVREYAGFDPQSLADAITRIGERLGGSRTKEALSALENKRFAEVAAIALSYYDKAYLFSMARRKSKKIHEFPIFGENLVEEAGRIIEFAYKYCEYGNDIP